MTPPLISICVANYNGLQLIDACLQSVLMQKGNFQLEILVHDDCSQDASVAYLQDHYPSVKLIESHENVGFCIANNRMAEQAAGDYLLLLNNDAALFPDALQTLLDEAGRLAAPTILSLPQYDAGSGELVDRGCLLDPFFNPVPNLDPMRVHVAMVIGACLWLPTSLWREIGGFPEWFGSIAEDMYLCCRARLLGHDVRVSPMSGYRHWQGRSFGGNRVETNRLATTYRRRVNSERNKSFVMALSCPAPWFQMIFTLHLLCLFCEGVTLAIFKREWKIFQDVYLASLLGIWKERARLFRFRREIQANRKIGLGRFMEPFSWKPRKLGLLLRHGLPRIT